MLDKAHFVLALDAFLKVGVDPAVRNVLSLSGLHITYR